MSGKKYEGGYAEPQSVVFVIIAINSGGKEDTASYFSKSSS